MLCFLSELSTQRHCLPHGGIFGLCNLKLTHSKHVAYSCGPPTHAKPHEMIFVGNWRNINKNWLGLTWLVSLASRPSSCGCSHGLAFVNNTQMAKTEMIFMFFGYRGNGVKVVRGSFRYHPIECKKTNPGWLSNGDNDICVRNQVLHIQSSSGLKVRGKVALSVCRARLQHHSVLCRVPHFSSYVCDTEWAPPLIR